MQNQGEYSFDLRVFGDVLRRYLGWLLLITVLVASLAGVITVFLVDKTYSSTVQFYVNSMGERDPDSAVETTEISASKYLVKSGIVIIGCDSFLETVSEKSGLGLSAKQISKMITMSSVSDTEILQVKVSHTDPKIAYAIANTITDLAPDYVKATVEGGNMKAFDRAQLDTEADSPNVVRGVIIAAILAFFLAYAIFLIRMLSDNTIHSEEDIKKICSYPFIGEIPRMEESTGQISAKAEDQKKEA